MKKLLVVLVVVVLFTSSNALCQNSVNAAPKKASWKKVIKAFKNYGDKVGKAYYFENGDYQILTTKSGKWISFVYFDSVIHVQFELKKSSGSFKVNYKYYDPGEVLFKTSKKFKIKSFNPRNQGVNYKVKVGYGTNKAYAKHNVNKNVSRVMKNFNKMLKNETGVSFKKLGFKKF